MADAGAPEIPALLAMAEAFRVMDRPEVAIRALEAVQERASVGMLVADASTREVRALVPGR